ncbi:hypothetical protein BDP55DRAFT_722927 [Colletotrichum godetiae]|uniref:Uncharacterized protein n=1 Tax=Colletotrichum godetiae TaxID=1209918 RepID=A0AAJ0B0J6_9PEZI|nr:uncharacterized protein BDP55DRAFT_722927 [Colletotrichum godetiae]KAK1700384.1 hypothetical protein BDP55DRAFT_722927 [Colletotrichum godetiae]
MNAPIQSPKRQDSTSSISSSSSHMSTNQMMAPPQPNGQQPPSTEAFLRDFTLVAEAAKRAQMAVMMRDFDDELSPTSREAFSNWLRPSF